MNFQHIRHSSLLAALLILASPFALGHNNNDDSSDLENIQHATKWLDSRARELQKLTGVPGIAIAVVFKDHVIYRKGFGVRNVVTREKVNPETVFQLASVSKSLASTVVAGTVGRGIVSWDDPVQRYYPEFTLSNPETASHVTIADMFSHRSGLPGQAGDDLEGFGCSRPEIIHQLRFFFPLNPLGSTYNYSNFGLTTGAEAVAKNAHKSWEDLSDEILYKPLGMNSSSSRWSDYYKSKNKADLHIRNAAGEWVLSARQPDPQSPAGGASSSVNDMARWMMLQLDEGSYKRHRVIEKNALLRTRQQVMPLPVTAMNPSGSFYGLGMVTGHDEKGMLRLRHSGAFSDGASTTFDMLPSKHLGIVVLTNGFPVGVPETIAQEFVDIVEYGHVKSDRFPQMLAMTKTILGKPEFESDIPPSNPTPAPQPINGTYHNNYFGNAVIVATGTDLHLTIDPCGHPDTFTVRHWDGDMFSFQSPPNSPPLYSLKYTPPQGANPAKIYIKSLDSNGFGTFAKVQ